jgi:hypothetical protein
VVYKIWWYFGDRPEKSEKSRNSPSRNKSRQIFQNLAEGLRNWQSLIFFLVCGMFRFHPVKLMKSTMDKSKIFELAERKGLKGLASKGGSLVNCLNYFHPGQVS